MANIYQKLSVVQSKIAAKKDRVNNYAKYEYRTLGAILEAYKKAAEGLELALVFKEELHPHENGRYFLECCAELISASESATETIQTKSVVEVDYNHKGMSREQIYGTAATYARKRAAEGLLCIDDNTDPDELPPQNAPSAQTAVDANYLRDLIARTSTDEAKLLSAYKANRIEELTPEHLEQAARILEKRLQK